MCAIFGAVVQKIQSVHELEVVNSLLEYIWAESHERGRDGRGFVLNASAELELVEYRQI